MKEIFLIIASHLQGLSDISWVDLDKGQLEFYETRPSVQFPAVLIGMQITRTHKISNTRQRCDLLITLRLAVDYHGNTSQITPDVARAESMRYLDLSDQLYSRLHGWGSELFNPLERQALREERRADGYKVVAIPFTTTYIQSTDI